MMNKKLIGLYFLDQVLSIFAMAVALFWSAGRIDWWAAWAAIGVWVAWFTAWAMACNPFFSQVVRIQSERGHTVATTGPYRYVRHPAYIGMILFEPGMSALLGSWWAIIVGVMYAILIIVRTALEDRTLQAELTGYADYARQVRYRLIPGIW
jgi:protein-S-isoprenylcysteine O-methyltransferase Ste14